MRLLNTETITLEEFFGDIPPYAILSHTWGNEEVSFQNMKAQDPRTKEKAGYEKILQTCREALRNDLKYAWVDTCCIDKTSSAELSEAINSMFTWYENAQICYAFLADVPSTINPHYLPRKVIQSRWFTRGWTLQELLAPCSVVFFASDWTSLETRRNLADVIAAATGIDQDVIEKLDSPSTNLRQLLNSISIAERMSWAAKRETTRVEDIAYCLLGIFGVNMPLLYGEGKRAFFRLQEEIIKGSNDESIFAWNPPDIDSNLLLDFAPASPEHDMAHSLRRTRMHDEYRIFADSPLAFRDCGDIIQCTAEDTSAAPFSLTNLGVYITPPKGWLWAGHPASDTERDGYYALLQCRRKHTHDSMLAMPINRTLSRDPNIWHRLPGPLRLVHHSEFRSLSLRSIYITAHHASPEFKFWIRSVPNGFDIQGLQTSDTSIWQPKSRTLSTQLGDTMDLAMVSWPLRMVIVPFVVPSNDRRSFIGIRLRARLPWGLRTWAMPMPLWADYRICSISPDQRESWLADSTTQPDGKWHAALPDGTAIYATVVNETIRGASLSVVDICLLPREPNCLPWFISNRIRRSIPYARETAESVLHFVDGLMVKIMFSSSRKLPLWPIFVAGITTVVFYSLLYFQFVRFPLPSTSNVIFHATDLTWYVTAAILETLDSRRGRKVKVIPIVVNCGIYAALTKLCFTQGPLAAYIAGFSLLFVAWNMISRQHGSMHMAYIFIHSLVIFPIIQNLLECSSVRC